MRRDAGSARPATLGIAAFVVGVVGVTVGAVLLFIAGIIVGPVTEFVDPAAETAPALEDLPPRAQELLAQAGGWYSAGIAIFGILAIWAGIQGVAAFVGRRGRRWAILAIAVAVIGYFVVTSAQQYGATFTSVPFGGETPSPSSSTSTPTP